MAARERCPLCGHDLPPRWDAQTPTPCRYCGARVAAPKTPRARTCRRKDCITRLDARNPGPYCRAHTPDLTATNPPHATRRDRPTVERFVEGIPDRLTPAERARYARGEW